MKIHAICLVKNEGDFIGESLAAAVGWCDAIYVFDTGSDDGSWEAVRELAGRFPAIIPFKREARDFNDGLRAEVFAAFRDRAAAGDWWCRLDADEVYAEDPRAFLSAVPRCHHVVWSIHLQYYFTDEDRRMHEAGGGALPRFYKANASEPRFFRHRDRLEWGGGAWPRHLGVVHPHRIMLKHFQYRSPAQIQRRLDTRRAAAAAGWEHFRHSLESDWREKVVPAADLDFDDGSGRYAIDESKLPRHLEPMPQRLVKRAMHGLGIWP